jgi:drug/metabolite transporter (DMT)-like permease
MPLLLYVLLGLLSLIWGASFFFIKVLLESFGPWSITFLRCLFGVLTLLVIMLIRREKVQFNHIPWKILIIVGLLNSAFPWTLIAFSETKISSSMAAVLNASTPIWTLIIGLLFFRISSSIYQFIGIIIGFLGILILVDIDWSTFQMTESLAVGAMILVTLFYGISSQLSKRHLQSTSVYQTALITLVVGMVTSGSAAVFFETPTWNQVVDPIVFFSLVGLGSLGSGIAYIIFFALIQKGSAEFATLVTYLVPPFAIMWGYIFLSETLSLSLFVGLFVILAGVFISGRKKKTAKVKVIEEHHGEALL